MFKKIVTLILLFDLTLVIVAVTKPIFGFGTGTKAKKEIRIEAGTDGGETAASETVTPEVKEIEENRETGDNGIHRYEVVMFDGSWSEALDYAADYGSYTYLAAITSREEWETVKPLLKASDANYVWLGASLEYDTLTYQWETGEEFLFEDWYENAERGIYEPSYSDSGDGAKEGYLCSWRMNGEFSWCDQRKDILADYPELSGQIGLLVEIEEE